MKTFFILFSRDHIADESMPPREVKVKTIKKIEIEKLSFWFQYLIFFFRLRQGPKEIYGKEQSTKFIQLSMYQKGQSKSMFLEYWNYLKKILKTFYLIIFRLDFDIRKEDPPTNVEQVLKNFKYIFKLKSK